jgi:prepilin peptidase CpaA
VRSAEFDDAGLLTLPEEVLQLAILLVGTCLFAIVAYPDIRTRRIRNEFILGILILAAIRLALAADPIASVYTLAASTALFVATFLLFWRGLLGGGDVKLLVVTGLLIGYHNLFEFLFVMSVCGALVAVAVLARNRFGLQPVTTPNSEQQETPARLTVPYGVAIAAAGIVTLFVQYFPPG